MAGKIAGRWETSGGYWKRKQELRRPYVARANRSFDLPETNLGESADLQEVKLVKLQAHRKFELEPAVPNTATRSELSSMPA